MIEGEQQNRNIRYKSWINAELELWASGQKRQWVDRVASSSGSISSGVFVITRHLRTGFRHRIRQLAPNCRFPRQCRVRIPSEFPLRAARWTT